jgi:hypothetical protein
MTAFLPRALISTLGAISVVVLLLLPVGTGQPTGKSVVFHAPFLSANATRTGYFGATGCATEHHPVLAHWNRYTGIGGFKIGASAASCGGPWSVNESDVAQMTNVVVPMSMLNGTGGMSARWTMSFEGRQKLNVTSIPTNCTVNYTLTISGNYCVAESLFFLNPIATLTDLSNNSTYYPRYHVPLYTFGEDYVDSSPSCFGCGGSHQAVNKSFTVVFNFTGSFNASHRYVLFCQIRGEVEVLMYGLNGTATASLNMATNGHGYQLDSIRIW